MRKLVYDVARPLDNFISHEDGSIDGFLPEGERLVPGQWRCWTTPAALYGR
jgi:hypothetical protein